MTSKRAPYGSWRSPITSELIVAQTVSLPDARIDGGKASLPVASYAGKYSDPWYGPMNIAFEKGALRIDSPARPA